MKKSNYLWLILLVAGTALILLRQNGIISWGEGRSYHNDKGLIFGTMYSITYEHDKSLKLDIDKRLLLFDASLSMFNDTSVISRINQNEDVIADSLFVNVFRQAMKISESTDGSFDITVAPLVNAWGFGFTKSENANPDKAKIDSLLQIVGWQKVHLTPEGKVVKQDPRITLDCSAIAKGYAVDVIANLLRGEGVQNFMVDIGGEVVVSGANPSGELWRIGISKPDDDPESRNQDLQTILKITNSGIATSGNYRNFYFRDGMKYAHTIDPKTGYPVQHSILSSTVIAKDCMTADAYATAFMVMGLERASALVEQHSELEAYFIYGDENGNYKTYMTDGMKKFVTK